MIYKKTGNLSQKYDKIARKHVLNINTNPKTRLILIESQPKKIVVVLVVVIGVVIVVIHDFSQKVRK